MSEQANSIFADTAGRPQPGQVGTMARASAATESTLPCKDADIRDLYSCSTSRSNCMKRDG
jgi:hypothetical protein